MLLYHNGKVEGEQIKEKGEKGEIEVESESRRKIYVAVLAVALAISLFFNGYLYYTLFHAENNLSENWTTTFNFWWSPEEQNITSGNGILWINFTFKPVGENLSITVKINDDDNGVAGPGANGGTLVLAFDCNFNGKIDYGDKDEPYDFRATNTTAGVSIDPNPSLTAFVACLPEPSPFHTCTFSDTTGYVFNIALPLEDIGTTGMVYAVFVDWDNPWLPELGRSRFEGGMWVHVQFSYLP